MTLIEGNQEPRNEDSLWKEKKVRNRFYPGAKEEMQSYWCLDFSLIRPIFGLLTYSAVG